MKTLGWLTFVCGTVAAQGVAPNPVAYKIEGEQADNLANSIVLLGDVDGDGVKDFAANKRYLPDADTSPGKVILYSGKQGKVLRTWEGEDRFDNLGYFALAAMPDLDGDGVPELGATANYAGLRVYSPVTGKLWYTASAFIDGGVNDGPGWEFVRLPDMDGDGIEEFVGGSPLASLSKEMTFSGRIALFSGRTGKSLWVRWGSFADGFLGASMLVSGDHNGDGIPDLLCMEQLPVSEGKSKFEHDDVIRVISSRTGELLRNYYPPGPWHFWFGVTMASLGDRDGDGFPEVAISAPKYREIPILPGPDGVDTIDGQSLGWVGIFRLPDFELLASVKGSDTRMGTFQGDQLGFRLAAAGDVDQDGIGDFMAAATRIDFPAPFIYGRLYLCSGADAHVLQVYEGRQGFDTYFERLLPLGDINGDGRPEFLSAHPSDDFLNGDRDATRPGAGSIQALRYEPSLPTYIRGDADGDGRVNLSDAITIVRYAADDFCVSSDRLPEPRPGCLAAYDIDADGCISRFDAIKLLQHYFGPHYPAPVAPFPQCSRFLRIEPLDFFPDLGCVEPRACAGDEDDP